MQTQDPSEPQPDGDWTDQATDTVVELVETVRAKATGPAITAARGVVYGMLAFIVAIVALTLLAIGLVRLIDVYLPGNVWSAHLLVGTLFVIAGLVTWSKRRAPDVVDAADA